MSEVEEFKQRLEAKQKAGLVDLKFAKGDVSRATVESFCAESNRIDRAIEQGNYTVFDHGD